MDLERLMRVTRNQLNPIGKLVYDFYRNNGESRKESLITAIEAQDCFISIEQAKAWIIKKQSE